MAARRPDPPSAFFNPELENLAEKQRKQALSNTSDHSELSYKITLILREQLHKMPTAEHLGFTDASNFAKAFKQWQGVTPSQYRKG